MNYSCSSNEGFAQLNVLDLLVFGKLLSPDDGGRRRLPGLASRSSLRGWHYLFVREVSSGGLRSDLPPCPQAVLLFASGVLVRASSIS